MRQITGGSALHFCVEDIALSARACKALTLICSELVCNAQKHGSGRIEVWFRGRGGQGQLQVRDNGPGFSAAHLLRRGEQNGIGLELVESLCSHDLCGQVRYSNHLGDSDGLGGSNRQGGGQVTVTFLL